MRIVTRQVRLFAAVAGTVATAASHAAQPGTWTSAETRADKQFTTYAYAHANKLSFLMPVARIAGELAVVEWALTALGLVRQLPALRARRAA